MVRKQKHKSSMVVRPARAVAWPSSVVIGWMRERLAAAGGDPGSIPDEPFRYWRLPEVEQRIGVRRSTVYRWIASRQFPPPLTLAGPPSPTIDWRTS
jgi:predicted DNA-binding transcriptional regulator AlpA